jgi:hypothetical protein
MKKINFKNKKKQKMIIKNSEIPEIPGTLVSRWGPKFIFSWDLKPSQTTAGMLSTNG